MQLKHYIEVVKNNQHLTFEQMADASNALFLDDTPEKDIEQFLIALQKKGEVASEIAALATVMRENARSLNVPEGLYMDNCGTGGDGLHTFNISTTSAFILAGAGIKVAKHGNRKISSQTGSSDVLEALGIHLIDDPSVTATLLDEVGLAFLHAPNFHPKLKRIGAIRNNIGTRTIFNYVGPLTNPIPLQTQFVGISRSDFALEYAKVLHLLGRKRAIVVSGAHQMDEANLAGENTFVLLDHGDFIPFKLKPEDVGLQPTSLAQIAGGSPDENAQILKRVLLGERSAYFDTAVFNAGTALFAYGLTETIEQGISLAKDVIDRGDAQNKLHEIILRTKEVGAN